MKKDAIKVVKRNKRNEAEKTQNVVEAPEVNSDTQHGIVKAVKNWISERRENSHAEKVFSDEKILDWESISEDFK